MTTKDFHVMIRYRKKKQGNEYVRKGKIMRFITTISKLHNERHEALPKADKQGFDLMCSLRISIGCNRNVLI